MRILLVNKFNFVNGGSDRYFIDTAEELSRLGHDVARFCMSHPENLPSPYEKYFVASVDYNRPQSFASAVRMAGRLLYNFEAKKKFKRLVLDFKPDVIHVHNIYHQISPSILPVAKKYGIPVIMHLHDYKLISPNYTLFCRGQICERGIAPHYFGCVRGRCVKDSYSKSFLAACEMHLHHTLLKIYEKNIDLYVAPSNFMKEMCVKHGVPAEKIRVLLNYCPEALPAPEKKKGYLLFAGRLSAEKGVDILLRAMATTRWHLKVTGAGPEEEKLHELASRLGISDRIEFLGRKTAADLKILMAAAAFVMAPSVWYENMPLVALEALACGTPVIASRIGGLPEIIKHGENGFLFTAGNSEELSGILDSNQLADISRLEKGALASVHGLDIQAHMQRLISLYEKYAR